MATSGSTDFTLNAGEVITYAFRLLRMVTTGLDLPAEQMQVGITSLNLMLKGWQLRGPNLFRTTQSSLAMTSATATYSLPTVYRVTSMRYRASDGRDLPMEYLTREEYFDLPNKASAGTPTQYYFDPQMASGTLYVWPVLATATTQTFEMTIQRRFMDIDARLNDIDIPQEYLETVAYALADRLSDVYAKDVPKITARSQQLIAQASAADREPVIRFEPVVRR